MKKMDKKAFTLVELIVVVAVVGILVLLGMPRFIGHKDKAELARIQHDVKVMEQEIGTVLINNDDDFNKWEDNSKDFNQLIQENRLFEKEGIAEKVESIDKTYKIIPEKYKDNINTKLKGTFYANNDGKVYYEHEKPLSGIPTESEEKEPEYSNEEIQDLIDSDYIPIATAEELNSIRNTSTRTYGKGTQWEGPYTGGLDKKYIQVLNLNLSEYSEREEGWSPIGTSSSSFTGTYDGGNHVIRGLEVKGEGKNNQGLFGYTQGAIIRNVGLIDNKVIGSWGVGGLVGLAYDSTIDNSYFTGSVTGEDGGVGGLVGEADNITIENSYATGSVIGTREVGGLVGEAESITIKNSYATGSVKGSGVYVGGLVGDIYGSTIINSYATSSVEGTEWVGGLLGQNYSVTTISNSYATGSVTGYQYVGGLVGQADEAFIEDSYATGSVEGSGDYVGGIVGLTNDSTISKSYATGSVKGTGTEYVGGLAGEAGGGTIENSYATGSVEGADYVGGLVGGAYWGATISNSYATGSVTGTGDEIGGLVGEVWNITEISNSYWDTESTGHTWSAEGVGKSTVEMKSKDTYSGWDFESVWQIDEGSDYPKLR